MFLSLLLSGLLGAMSASISTHESSGYLALPMLRSEIIADSGFLVRDHGGFRSSSMSIGSYKATRIKTSRRKESRHGGFLLGEKREHWSTEFELPESDGGAVVHTHCALDRLLSPAKAASRPLNGQRLFGMACSIDNDLEWSLTIDAGIPSPELTTADAAQGIPIGTLILDGEEWSVVASGARRLLPFLWTHPNAFELRDSGGQLDAVIFVHPRRRVWLRAELPERSRMAMTRAAVALLLAEPLVDEDTP